MTVGSLFSGIGGCDLGLERAGMRVLWQCEIDPYCRAVLRKHWPGVPCYEDIRAVNDAAPRVDVLCGGVPCQPVSQAAARSSRGTGWLWSEMVRVTDALRPRFVVLENPEALRYANRGLSEVLSDLADLGFDAEWRVIRASDFGAPHKRARLWLVAHTDRDGEPVLPVDDEASFLPESGEPVYGWADPPGFRVDDGVSARVDRARALGNAVVPQGAEWLGRLLMATSGPEVGEGG